MYSLVRTMSKPDGLLSCPSAVARRRSRPREDTPAVAPAQPPLETWVTALVCLRVSGGASPVDAGDGVSFRVGAVSGSESKRVGVDDGNQRTRGQGRPGWLSSVLGAFPCRLSVLNRVVLFLDVADQVGL